MKIRGFLEDLIKRMLAGEASRIGNTLEIQNIHGRVALEGTDWESEVASMDEFLSSLGLSLKKKHEEEEYHYSFLKYALLQKVRAVRYFHDQGIDSRKLVVFSEDCISLIQWLSRPQLKQNHLNVYIRSSDVVGLLGVDLLFVYDIYLEMLREHPEIADYDGFLNVWVSSAHIYWDDAKGVPTTRDGQEIKVQ